MERAEYHRHSRARMAETAKDASRHSTPAPGRAPARTAVDCPITTSGAAPLIVDGFRRVRRSTFTEGAIMERAEYHRHSRARMAETAKDASRHATPAPGRAPARTAVDCPITTSGAAPLIVDGFRRVRRSTFTEGAIMERAQYNRHSRARMAETAKDASRHATPDAPERVDPRRRRTGCRHRTIYGGSRGSASLPSRCENASKCDFSIFARRAEP